MFQTKTIKKKYMALVVGRLEGSGEVTTEMDGRTATSTCVTIRFTNAGLLLPARKLDLPPP
jgi:hypothetical protein